MMPDEKRISLKIDVNNGTIELDAPVESFDQAIAKTKELTDTLDIGRNARSGEATANGPSEPERSRSPSPPSNRERARAKSSRTAPSTGRSGRLGSFEPLKDLLTEDQQKSLRDFVHEKAPAEQSDQVQVAIYKGEELLSRQGFSYNEIYTLMWRAGIDPLPRALDVVISHLVQDQRVEKGPDGFFLKFLGRDRVERELPPTGKEVA